MTTYDRPVSASLHVHLENGEIFQAGPDDLRKFGYVDRSKVFSGIYDRLVSIMQQNDLFTRERGDVTELQIAPLFNLVTIFLMHPELADHWENEATYVEVINMERQLRGMEPLAVPTYEEMLARKEQESNGS